MKDHATFPIGINVFAIRGGKLLLGLRKGSAGEGMWGLPGGHLEEGEDMATAAARELNEETSLEAGSFKFINLANDNANPRRHYVQAGFLADKIKGEVQLLEPDHCSEWKWFPMEELPENVFFGHVKQIELFLNHLHFGDSKE